MQISWQSQHLAAVGARMEPIATHSPPNSNGSFWKADDNAAEEDVGHGSHPRHDLFEDNVGNYVAT